MIDAILLIVAVLIGGVLYWRRPSYRFWRFVAAHPEEAFETFRDSPDWQITYSGSIEEEELKRDGWSGPYSFFVPKLGTDVRVFGRHPEYLAFQKRVIRANRFFT
jgi:hypothetical protein